MSTLALNPRYANYCRANGNTPAQQEVADTGLGGHTMINYVEWNRARLVEASKVIPEAFFMGQLSNHDLYNDWLTKWVDAKVLA